QFFSQGFFTSTKKYDVGNQMLMMIHKSSRQSAMWQREQRELQLDRDALDQRARESKLQAAQKDEDQRAARQEAMQIWMDEACRFEATQAAAEKSWMVFESTMLSFIANLGRGRAGGS
ncbi:hypothetical protein VP01_10155g1, partial [Puccinia sorghi]